MEKKIIYENRGEESSIWHPWGPLMAVSILEMERIIKEAKDLGANTLEIVTSYDYDGPLDGIFLQPVLIREETKEEFEERIGREAFLEHQVNERRLQDERDLYDQLKKKFEP